MLAETAMQQPAHVDDDFEKILSDILQSVRLCSALLSRACLRPPYGVHTRGAPRPIFHGVVHGTLCFRRDGDDGEALQLGPGDVVVLTRGDGHTLSDAPDRVAVPIGTLARSRTRSHVEQVETAGTGDAAHVLCGTFSFAHKAGEAMLALLPRVMVVRSDQGTLVPWLSETLAMLDRELDRETPGGDAMVTRLVDLLVAHLLRRCVLSAPGQGGGWLSALRDPKIGRALAAIHRNPHHDWTASSLAGVVGMSRSAFFARFTDLVGEPPAQYLTRWRMQVAADLLEDDGLSLGQLAERVGYGSEDAFSKVFKRHMGCSPAQYRRQLRAEAARM